MKEGKKRNLLLVLFAAAIMLMCAVPVSAASKRFTTTVTSGQCVHIMNNNINGNAISQYTYRIMPKTSGTRYDVVYASSGEAVAVKACRTDSGNITNSTYLKSSRTSNSGMIACIKVTSGSVAVSVVVTTTNPKAKIVRTNMSAKDHSPLKAVKVEKGKKMWLKRTSGNISTLPLIIAGRKGVAIKRKLTSSSYETYNFKSGYTVFRRYVNKKCKVSLQRKYATTYGSTRYYSFLVPANSSGVAYTGEMTTKKGTVMYYYPSDFLKVTGAVRSA